MAALNVLRAVASDSLAEQGAPTASTSLLLPLLLPPPPPLPLPLLLLLLINLSGCFVCLCAAAFLGAAAKHGNVQLF